MTDLTGRFVVVRTYSAGVHAGVLASRDGKAVELTDARRLTYWHLDSGHSLNGVATTGPSSKSRLSESIPLLQLLEAIEVLPASEAAEKAIREAEVFRE